MLAKVKNASGRIGIFTITKCVNQLHVKRDTRFDYQIGIYNGECLNDSNVLEDLYPCPSAVSLQYICSVSAVSTSCALDRPAVHKGSTINH